MRAWGSLERRVGARVQRIDKRRIDYVAALLHDTGLDKDEAARRARILYATLVGEFLMRSHGAPALAPAALHSLYALLLQGAAAEQRRKTARR